MKLLPLFLALAMAALGCGNDPTSTSACAYKQAQRDAKTYAEILKATENQLDDLCERAYGNDWGFSEYSPSHEPACANVVYKPLPGIAMTECDE